MIDHKCVCTSTVCAFICHSGHVCSSMTCRMPHGRLEVCMLIDNMCFHHSGCVCKSKVAGCLGHLPAVVQR